MPEHIIVSGASGNLGKEVVRKLTALGYELHVNLRSDKASMFTENARVHAYPADLASADEAQIFAQQAIKQAGHIRAGIFLAGGYAPGKLAHTSSADIEKMMQTNFLTAFHLVKPLLAHFEENGAGQLMLIGARPALEAAQGAESFAYALSKSLLFQMADIINADGEKKNITATVVLPSIIDTPDNRNAMPDADFTTWISPADMAESIAFVLSETGKKLRQTILKLYNKA